MSHEVYDEQARTSVCHGFSTATSVLGAYKMEMFILMELNQTGEKIVKIDEMVDSAYISDYLARLTAHMQAQGQTA